MNKLYAVLVSGLIFVTLILSLIFGVRLVNYQRAENFKNLFNELVDSYNESIDVLNKSLYVSSAVEVNLDETSMHIEKIDNTNVSSEEWIQIKSNLTELQELVENKKDQKLINYKINLINYFIKDLETKLNESQFI